MVKYLQCRTGGLSVRSAIGTGGLRESPRMNGLRICSCSAGTAKVNFGLISQRASALKAEADDMTQTCVVLSASALLLCLPWR